MSQNPASLSPAAATSSGRGAGSAAAMLRSLAATPSQVWGTVVLAIVIRCALAIITRYTSEDFMITLRYAENMASGHGMVYNFGERVLGTTTPLYTLYLALAAYLHLSPTICGKAINILADGILPLLLYHWLKHEGLERPGRIAAFLAAIHPIHYQWAISGMETSLVTTAGVWAWYAFSRRRHAETFTALAILFLLRYDSLMMTAVITAAILWRERRVPWRGLCIFLVLISPWLLVASLYYGSPIPVTGQAKILVYGWFADHIPASRLRYDAAGHGQGVTGFIALEPTWLLRLLPRQQKLLNVFIGTPVAALLTIAAMVGAWHLARLRRWTLAPAVIWLLLYMAAFLVSRVLLFNWYLVPPFPVVEILAAVGISIGLNRVSRVLPMPAQRVAGYAVLATAALAPAIAMAVTLRQSQQIEENARRPIGEWLNLNSRPDDHVLLEPIGYIGYYSRRRVIDVIGLVSPQVLPFYSPRVLSPWLAQIITYKPEWCVLRPLELEDIEAAARVEGYDWKSEYALERTWAYTPRKHEAPLMFYLFRRTHSSPLVR